MLRGNSSGGIVRSNTTSRPRSMKTRISNPLPTPRRKMYNGGSTSVGSHIRSGKLQSTTGANKGGNGTRTPHQCSCCACQSPGTGCNAPDCTTYGTCTEYYNFGCKCCKAVPVPDFNPQ
jgi:hypothetical protein